MPSQKIETGHQDAVHSASIDYYGTRLATASSDSTVKITPLAAAGGAPTATLAGHTGPVWHAAWAHPKFGSLLATCGYDARVILWTESSPSSGDWSQAQVFTHHASSVNAIAFAPHHLGLALACASSDGTLSVLTARPDGGWDTARIERAHPVGANAVSWSHDNQLASGGCDYTVKIWKLYNRSWKPDCLHAPLQMHTDWVRDVAWAPNLGLARATVASASQDGTVVVWTAAKEGEQWKGKVMHDFKAPVWRVSWSLTGNILAVADGNGDVTLWKEAADGEWQQVTKVEP